VRGKKRKGERSRWTLVPLGPKAGIGRFFVVVVFISKPIQKQFEKLFYKQFELL